MAATIVVPHPRLSSHRLAIAMASQKIAQMRRWTLSVCRGRPPPRRAPLTMCRARAPLPPPARRPAAPGCALSTTPASVSALSPHHALHASPPHRPSSTVSPRRPSARGAGRADRPDRARARVRAPPAIPQESRLQPLRGIAAPTARNLAHKLTNVVRNPASGWRHGGDTGTLGHAAAPRAGAAGGGRPLPRPRARHR